MSLLFVYGTLKKGFHNHGVLKGAHCQGEAVLFGYDMYSLGGFPAIVKNVDAELPISGELYEVPEFKSLDRLEGVPHMYTREEETVLWQDCLTGAYVYVWNRSIEGLKKIEDGVWK